LLPPGAFPRSLASASALANTAQGHFSAHGTSSSAWSSSHRGLSGHSAAANGSARAGGNDETTPLDLTAAAVATVADAEDEATGGSAALAAQAEAGRALLRALALSGEALVVESASLRVLTSAVTRARDQSGAAVLWGSHNPAGHMHFVDPQGQIQSQSDCEYSGGAGWVGAAAGTTGRELPYISRYVIVATENEAIIRVRTI